MKLNKKTKGFTIVELVIVIGVIGILSAVLIPTFVNVTKNAEQAALKSNLANAYAAYAADAADRKLDSDPTKELEFYSQSHVVLSATNSQNVTKGYLFGENGWATEEANQNANIVPNSGAYNGYYIYYFE